VSTSGTIVEPAAPSAAPSEPRSSAVPQFGTPPGEVGAAAEVRTADGATALGGLVPGEGSGVPAVDPAQPASTTNAVPTSAHIPTTRHLPIRA
jgi:hypothetical protein